MIKIDNLVINADVTDIITTLKEYLAERDINLLRDVKPSSENTQVTCPFHKDGVESKPSFGIKHDTGQGHCFTCGWTGTIDVMISEIMEKFDDGKFGRKWLAINFNNYEIEERVKLNLPTRRTAKEKKTTNYVSDEELDKYRYYHDYMFKRGLTEDIIELFDIGYDKDTNCITFPISDYMGNVLFLAKRSVATKFFSYPENVDKPVYALNKCKNDKKVYVCESVFNALTYWVNGRKAVALLGLGSEHQYKILEKSSIRHFVLALDPDEAGRKACLKFRKRLSKSKIISEVVYADNRDINDLGKECLELEEIF